ncbi:hypothetical protein POVWA2_014380 [Plasmodium ovale wallikeri]|uniref:Uncharacterized protein n=1 Tax=Plasmodium ovale wallikeri TaxID=864142 RepID=A0A1A8YPA4_PLAOA|nr:hypothetical protein POVWA1_014540 [Plasmodium ovale wallikeri]SBT33368.1 hypothetical protein POVWA2_014380 [Plasmodium ovale wallikeri]
MAVYACGDTHSHLFETPLNRCLAIRDSLSFMHLSKIPVLKIAFKCTAYRGVFRPFPFLSHFASPTFSSCVHKRLSSNFNESKNSKSPKRGATPLPSCEVRQKGKARSENREAKSAKRK